MTDSKNKMNYDIIEIQKSHPLFKIIKDDYFNFRSFNFSRNLEEFLNIEENTSLPAMLLIENLNQKRKFAETRRIKIINC